MGSIRVTGASYFRFPGISFDKRLSHHFQGLTMLGHDVWAFSRNGDTWGQVYVMRDRDVRTVRFAKRHIGGIDSAEGVVVIPQYEPEDGTTTGTLAIMDCNTDEGLQYDPNQVSQHDLDYRPYAAAICKWGIGKTFLLAVVGHADGQETHFYRWTPDGLTPLYTQHWLSLEGVSRNNITLHSGGGHRYLYYQRAHLGFETVTRYRLKLRDNGHTIGFGDKQVYRKRRRGLCSSRFASTILNRQEGQIWVRTQRNAWLGGLRFRQDLIQWEE